RMGPGNRASGPRARRRFSASKTLSGRRRCRICREYLKEKIDVCSPAFRRNLSPAFSLKTARDVRSPSLGDRRFLQKAVLRTYILFVAQHAAGVQVIPVHYGI